MPATVGGGVVSGSLVSPPGGTAVPIVTAATAAATIGAGTAR
ncbi:hypothetical protein ACGFXB_31695 [Streptomyces canus]